MAKKLKTYNIYVRKDSASPLETAVFLKDGFNLWAFLFSGIWALYYRVWRLLLLVILVSAGLGILEKLGYISEQASVSVQLVFGLWVGFEANEWGGAALERRGYVLHDIIVAGNLLEAQRRYFDRYLENKPASPVGVTNNTGNNSSYHAIAPYSV